ncbi:PASTA domain-containing protein [Nannocystis sp.]|uniref:PASTA domain-containing protein n=1 Tax=Nannocystis sp. TaxID=1962667 RepID=UPI0024219420|nr:PASTA domain-containing protein [Nannocystis sp.]MBK7826360.1 PASTA domain-containing protein [Nannocystis sp.]MBK9757877.1 PASTA domain-containing protein [Nannocystis sp.]
MNDTVKMFLISLITAVLVQVLLGPQIMKMQQAQGLLPPFATTPVAGVGPGPGPGPGAGPGVQPQPVPQPVVQPDPGVAAIPAPNLVGTPIKDARKVASSQGIVLIEDESRDAPDATPGEILEQIPAPGVSLSTREIRVVTAKAREARVPDLVGKPIAEAKQALADLGIEVTEVQKDSSKAPGTVLSQKPLPKAKLSPGTPVELTIAALPLIEVPVLAGKYLNSAKTALKDTGLELGDIRRTEHEEHGENYVLRQDPAAGSKVPFGTAVNLTVVAPN